jgi:group II intron reverse transcriptase/maturase
MLTKLAKIAEVAQTRPTEKFTSLGHLINEELLTICHNEARGRKATGVDLVTKEKYNENLETNIKDLVARLKRRGYHPQPVKRVYIPKPGSSIKRPLGIPAYEDKLVQAALSKILNAVYETEFLNCSYGFRPERGVHDALKAINYLIEKRQVNYVVDADIRSFFNRVDHEWLLKFVQHRIADPNIYRLIYRFLRAGVMEEGKRYATLEGTPQGGVVSPILANIYLHYVVDIWFKKVVQKQLKGEAYMVRYADDIVFCFQYENEAKLFYQALIERLAKFNLEVAGDKTKIIPFGKGAEEQNQKNGKDKPDTFDFLGFTHYCGKSRHGKFRVKRKTSKKKYRGSLLKFKKWVIENRNMPIHELWEQVINKLRGYYQHYGITDNSYMMANYFYEAKKILFKWLNRRSQRKSFNWNKFGLFLNKHPLPRPKMYVSIFEFRPGIALPL